MDALTALAVVILYVVGYTGLHSNLNWGEFVQVSTLESLGTVGTNYKNQTLTFGAGGTIESFGSNATITQGDIPACQVSPIQGC